MSAGQLANLLGAIHAAPSLPAAACKGMSATFDPREQGETAQDAEQRHQTALRLCRTCPALASCAEWFDALPASQRPEGVVAGRLTHPQPEGTPGGRQQTTRPTQQTRAGRDAVVTARRAPADAPTCADAAGPQASDLRKRRPTPKKLRGAPFPDPSAPVRFFSTDRKVSGTEDPAGDSSEASKHSERVSKRIGRALQ